jgi:hypothetical protein
MRSTRSDLCVPPGTSACPHRGRAQPLPWARRDLVVGTTSRPALRRWTVEYEIEVEELKDRKRGLGRLAVITLLGCALLLVARQIL